MHFPENAVVSAAMLRGIEIISFKIAEYHLNGRKYSER
jgi:hypothetical protein